jgi:hypothetical protein
LPSILFKRRSSIVQVPAQVVHGEDTGGMKQSTPECPEQSAQSNRHLLRYSLRHPLHTVGELRKRAGTYNSGLLRARATQGVLDQFCPGFREQVVPDPLGARLRRLDEAIVTPLVQPLAGRGCGNSEPRHHVRCGWSCGWRAAGPPAGATARDRAVTAAPRPRPGLTR